MKRRKHKYILLLLDLFVINLSFYLAFQLRTGLKLDFVMNRPPYLSPEVVFALGYSVVMVFFFQANRLYKINIYLSAGKQLQRIFACLTVSILGIVVLSFVTKSKVIVDSRLVILYFCLFSFLFLVTARVLLFRSVFQYLVKKGQISWRVVIAGTGKTALRLASGISNGNPQGLTLIGFLDDATPAGTVVQRGFFVLGKTCDVEQIVEEQRVDEIVVCLEELPDNACWDLLERFAKTRAAVMIGASERFKVVPERMYHEEYGDIPVFGVMNFAPYMGQLWVKRVIDLTLSFAGIIILVPFYLVIAAAIKLNSPGPVLYRQKRIGKNGRAFTFYKFRSMYVGSDADKSREAKLKEFIKEKENGSNGSTKIVDDAKVTAIGQFIRKTSIDEFPQLFNVLRGDMSLVGPRPCLPYEWEHYEGWHKRRLRVTPGLTGVWQVLGRSQVSFRDMIILDLYYAHNVSFHLDIWLLFKTVPVILFGTGGK